MAKKCGLSRTDISRPALSKSLGANDEDQNIDESYCNNSVDSFPNLGDYILRLGCGVINVRSELENALRTKGTVHKTRAAVRIIKAGGGCHVHTHHSHGEGNDVETCD